VATSTIRDDSAVPSRIGVLREPGFRRFWIGQSILFIGSQVIVLALSLTAVIMLDASAPDSADRPGRR
jgi:hypothetical protein